MSRRKAKQLMSAAFCLVLVGLSLILMSKLTCKATVGEHCW